MSPKLTVHYETLSEAIADLDSIAKALQEHLTEGEEAVRRLSESWEGESHKLFQAYYRQWSVAARDLQRIIGALHQTLHTAHGNYSIAREASLRTWGQ